MLTPFLEVEGMWKSFGGVHALQDAKFRLEPGTIHALCGGNGAGKSTFLKIVMGIQRCDAGVMLRDGVEVSFSSPSDALLAGISIIEQELNPVPAMSVAENIFLGREPIGSFGRVDFRQMNRAAGELLDGLGFTISPKALMMDLTIAQLQLVEIAKALSHDAEIIIMDEPTSALGEQEADFLFDAIRKLKERGKAIIYVSHRLSEIFQIADTYTVFRDGSYVATGLVKDVTRGDLIQMIVGRPLTEEFVKRNTISEDVALEVSGLTHGGKLSDISFKARRGEILALYGLMGAGRTEILESLFGLEPDSSARIKIDGKPVKIQNVKQAIRNGLALVTEDRKASGLVMSETVRANICLAHLKALGTGPVMRTGAEAAAARWMIKLFNIKTPNDKLLVSGLSGGNQQKVVLGKWFLTEPRILLLDEPTRGVDVGAKREIYGIMSEFASNGGTVVMASSETDEVLGMADNIIVIHDGKISGRLTRAEATAEKLVHLAV
ncbi:MAG: sugar ABC transporter ATP-binding protein [Henriciella sp.]|nr:sugar ABC transporter ATP-binding protein [Henriciella sp.]